MHDRIHDKVQNVYEDKDDWVLDGLKLKTN